jgi:hypothetical protein
MTGSPDQTGPNMTDPDDSTKLDSLSPPLAELRGAAG